MRKIAGSPYLGMATPVVHEPRPDRDDRVDWGPGALVERLSLAG